MSHYWAMLTFFVLVQPTPPGGGALADCYMHNPRGTNNKLSEQSNNVQNDERLFDSQNNGQAGYQIGDNCNPVCQDENENYDETKPGAMQGVMSYFQGSELYIEWAAQHGCGVGHPNVRCEFILQYMSEIDNPSIRDGTKRGNNNKAGGNNEPPQAEDANDQTLGQHEPLDFYIKCKERERNKGLYTADQNMNNNRGATATRQNNNGNGNNDRHGLECPEERDYYPYWHPTPWHDIAIITEEPEIRCAFYLNSSQNVVAKGECSISAHNNPEACSEGGGSWIEQPAFDEPPPECTGGLSSRDNHNGNARNGHNLYYVWTIPEYLQGRTALRIRYNITTKDLDPDALINEGKELGDHFFLDATQNDPNPGQRRRSPFKEKKPVIGNDPQADFLGLGNNRVLQVQLNTNQVARTFQDRSHTFLVKERPRDVPESARIVNYNVRGRRGNIQQVYPAVEYDFVPPDLTVEEGTFLHFQWTGSDANPKGNAGNGRQGTDRSNLVQMRSAGENIPLPIDRQTLFFDATKEPNDLEGRALVENFAFLDQDANVECDTDENNANEVDNCKQLNGASAYFDGGLVQMKQVGEHHIASTRNNDFSNRSHKSIITVVSNTWKVAAAVGLGMIVAGAFVAYIGAALYGYMRPTSWVFGKHYRPRIIQCFVSKATFEAKLQARKKCKEANRLKWLASTGAKDTGANMDMAKPIERPSKLQKCLQACFLIGLTEMRLVLVMYGLLNLVMFWVGFFANWEGGFRGSIAFPVAKGGGYMLDLNFAMLVLPTLKSLQTALRGAGTREWLPIDDPISFHIQVSGFIALGSVIHIIGHIFHAMLIAGAPKFQSDPYNLLLLTPDEQVSGSTYLAILFNLNYRCAPVTGILLVVLMSLIYLTALPCSRRGTNALTKKLGGYNLFWRFHMCWHWVYLLNLLHGPLRFWIWHFFPALFLVLDRIMLQQRQRPHLVLRTAELLPRDVLKLVFELPKDFTYQAGQYVHLGWLNEWHPFTPSSAPEENGLSLHIRCPDQLDWCSALKRRLVIEAPALAKGSKDLESGGSKSSQGAVQYYRPCFSKGQNIIYCRPSSAPMGPDDNKGSKTASLFSSTISRWRTQLETNSSQREQREAGSATDGDAAERTASLPDDGVVLQIAGPFGAPAQKVWQFETVMILGAGIGVTPFASILRSVNLRAKQRQLLMKHPVWITPGTQKDARISDEEHLLAQVVKVPKKIHFYWIVRNQEELDWFSGLLGEALKGPARDIVELSAFMTGEIELSKVKDLDYLTPQNQFFGRPSWARIFKKNKELHRGQHIGVFLCGSPMIGKELGKQSANHTDPQEAPGATRFSFFSESF